MLTERWLWALFRLYTTCNNEEWFCVDNVAQRETLAVLICLLPELTVSRLFGIMVTTSPRLTQLVFYVKASNVSGSKQERSTELVKWEKSEGKVRTDKIPHFLDQAEPWSLQNNPHWRLRPQLLRVKLWCVNPLNSMMPHIMPLFQASHQYLRQCLVS